MYSKVEGTHFFFYSRIICVHWNKCDKFCFVSFCLMERMMNSLLALTPGFKAAFDVKAVVLTLPTMGTTSSLNKLLALPTEGCLIGQPDQLCGFLDVGCILSILDGKKE